MAEILHFSLELKFGKYSEIHTKRFQNTITKEKFQAFLKAGRNVNSSIGNSHIY